MDRSELEEFLPNETTAQRVRGDSPEVQETALELRRNLTPAEKVLWEALRLRRLDGLRFRCQHPLGPFILDFCCISHRLVVELDGGVHDAPDQRTRDQARTDKLEAYGYTVLRFRNETVFDDIAGVLTRISSIAARQHRQTPALPRMIGTSQS